MLPVLVTRKPPHARRRARQEVDEPSLVVLWAICDDRLNDPIAQ